jgi:hypothetical protein
VIRGDAITGAGVVVWREQVRPESSTKSAALASEGIFVQHPYGTIIFPALRPHSLTHSLAHVLALQLSFISLFSTGQVRSAKVSKGRDKHHSVQHSHCTTASLCSVQVPPHPVSE